MNRWTLRIAALLMILMFLLLFAHLQKQLVEIQRSQQAPVTRT